jgi:hypothetical protein
MTAFRAWVTVTGALLAGLAFTGCQTEPTTSHNVALLYGIAIYDPANPTDANNLTYPAADANALTPLLSVDTGGIFHVTSRTDSDATRAAIVADIQTAAATLGPDDEFLFYYSGHGEQGASTGVGGVDGHAYILPYGSVTTGSPVIDSSQIITEDDLRTLLATLPTKKVVVILDCCFSGGFVQKVSSDGVPQDTAAYYTALWAAFLAGKAPSSETDLASWYSETTTSETAALASWNKALAAGSGFANDQAQVLTAAGALEQSYDDNTPGTAGSHNWQHGAFTHFLLDAKAYGDYDGNGYVTVSEAYRYSFEGLQAQWNGVWGAVGAGTLALSNYHAFLPHLSQGPADFLLFKR